MCEGKTVRTPTLQNTRNPEWNSGALFFVRRPKNTHLVVQVRTLQRGGKERPGLNKFSLGFKSKARTSSMIKVELRLNISSSICLLRLVNVGRFLFFYFFLVCFCTQDSFWERLSQFVWNWVSWSGADCHCLICTFSLSFFCPFSWPFFSLATFCVSYSFWLV